MTAKTWWMSKASGSSVCLQHGRAVEGRALHRPRPTTPMRQSPSSSGDEAGVDLELGGALGDVGEHADDRRGAGGLLGERRPVLVQPAQRRRPTPLRGRRARRHAAPRSASDSVAPDGGDHLGAAVERGRAGRRTA